MSTTALSKGRGLERPSTSPVCLEKAAPFSVEETFEHFIEAQAANVPLPGSGCTWQRFDALSSCAAVDLSLGRLVEGHFDALAILAEAGLASNHPGAAYGVWAARSRLGGTKAVRVPGGWRLSGSKQFCSGSGIIHRALVTADAPDGYRLFDLDVAVHVRSSEPDSWPSVGMADSASETLIFDGPLIDEHDAVGGPDFYTTRPGLWFGAVGVAACWFGGASGLVDGLMGMLDQDAGEHVLADFGRAISQVSAMRDVLADAARRIDADPVDAAGDARFRALKTRQIVHDLSLEVLKTTAAAGGARLLCHDRGQARRAADLFVYLAQHHGGLDAAELGRTALKGLSHC